MIYDKNQKIVIYCKNLLTDEDFVDYCKKEIHEIVKEGRIDIQDLHNVVNIILYIQEHKTKQTIPRDIISDVMEAFIIELLAKYNIIITNKQYEDLFKNLKDIIGNILRKRIK